MGYDVFTSISAEVCCYTPQEEETLCHIANKHLELIKKSNETVNKVVDIFLSNIIDGRCLFHAPKGDGLSWAAVGNYSDAENIAIDLKPFFCDLYKTRLMFNFAGIIIATNPSDPGSNKPTKVVELRLTSDGDYKMRFGKEISVDDIQIKVFEQDWRWGGIYE